MEARFIRDRLDKLRNVMEEQGWDALFFADTANVSYLSGFTNDDSFLLLTARSCGAGNYFLTDSRYTEQASRECTEYQLVEYRDKFPPLPETVALLCRDNGAKRLGFEKQHISYMQYQDIAAACGQDVAFEPAGPIVEELRVVKDAAEAPLLRAACAATDKVFAGLLDYIRPGLTEKQVEWQLKTLVYQQGCEDSFQPIVVSGPNAAMPHGVAGDRVLRSGDVLTMDFGCMYKGYHADMTRTVAIGKLDEQGKKIYNTVLEANLRAEAAMKAGVNGKIPDDAARGYITECGYGPNFGHGLGHGVGLDIHEIPYMGPRCTATLQAGCFITVEPGIYLPGWGGVRIEDTVLVTEHGVENLYTSAKELIEL